MCAHGKQGRSQFHSDSPGSAVLGFLLYTHTHIHIHTRAPVSTRNFASLCIRIIVRHKYRKLAAAIYTRLKREQERERERVVRQPDKSFVDAQSASFFQLARFRSIKTLYPATTRWIADATTTGEKEGEHCKIAGRRSSSTESRREEASGKFPWKFHG